MSRMPRGRPSALTTSSWLYPSSSSAGPTRGTVNPPTAACGKCERKLSLRLCARDDDLQRIGRGALAGALVYHPWFLVDRREQYMRDLGCGSAISVHSHERHNTVLPTPSYLVDISVHAASAVLFTEMTIIDNRVSRCNNDCKLLDVPSSSMS